MDSIMLGFLISVLVLGIVYLLILYKNGKKVEIFRIVEALVYEAEIKFGSGTGSLKYEYVVKAIYKLLPKPITIFISQELLDVWIETAVNELQEILAKETAKK